MDQSCLYFKSFTNKSEMHQSIFFKILIGFSLFSLFIAGCQPSSSKKGKEGGAQNNQPVKTLNVYTFYQSVEDKDLVKRFANLTGSTVAFKVLEPQDLSEQFINGSITPDLIILNDLSLVLKAKAAGLLQPFSTGDMENNIPSKYKDNDGFWYAIGKSGLAVLYNKDKINPGEIKTYADLTKSEYKGRLLMSSISDNTNRQLLAGMIAGEGEATAKRFAKGLVANQAKPPMGTDLDVIRGITQGEGDLAIVDIASILKFRYSGNPDDFKAAENLSMVYPVNKDGVTYISFRFIAMPKNTGARDAALRFAEYLTNDSAQQAISAGSFLFPTNPMVLPSDFLIDQGGYKDLGTDLNIIGQLDEQARTIAGDLGWE